MTDVQQAAIVASGSHLEGHETAVVSALDEEDEDENALADRVPEDVTHLQACITAAQGCLLLLVLKQHLKTIYGLSDRYDNYLCFITMILYNLSFFIVKFSNTLLPNRRKFMKKLQIEEVARILILKLQ